MSRSALFVVCSPSPLPVALALLFTWLTSLSFLPFLCPRALPFARGPSALAKAQAGDYDVAATRAELQQIIDGSKVVMFSFTT